jgi:hypothetical protein
MRREQPTDDMVSSRFLHALMVSESDKINLTCQNLRNDSWSCQAFQQIRAIIITFCYVFNNFKLRVLQCRVTYPRRYGYRCVPRIDPFG